MRHIALWLTLLFVPLASAQISDGGSGYSPGGGSLVSGFAEPVFDVQLYSAVPNDGIDDTAGINAAVAAAVAAGGGVVYFPAGVYVAQGIDLAIGVSFQGAGNAKSIEDGAQATASSKIVAPAAPVAATPIFRFPKGSAFQTNELCHLGAQFADLMISGGLDSENLAIPSAVSANLLVGIDFRTEQKTVCTFNNTNERVTCASHGLAVGDRIQFDCAPTATVPTLSAGGTFYSNFTYVVESVVDANTFTVELLNGTNLNFSSNGTGTFYVGTALYGINETYIERCTFRNLDCGIRGGAVFDYYRCTNCGFYANWVGVDAQEHPRIFECDLAANKCAITGRFLDAIITDNLIGGNDYGVAPSGTGGLWGSTFGVSDGTRGSTITYSLIADTQFYKNKTAGLVIDVKCTVTGCEFVGDGSGTAGFEGNVGLRVNSVYCNIFGNNFGQGATDSSFERCAIAMDAIGGTTNDMTIIQGNNFYLSGCPAIQRTDIGGGTYGTTSANAAFWTIIGNVLICTGDKLIDHRPGAANEAYHCTVNDNTILSTGVNGTVGATGAFIDMCMGDNMIFRDNILLVAATGQFLIKQNCNAASGLDGSIECNRTNGATACLDLAAGTPINAIVRGNTGADAVQDAYNNPREYVLKSNFTRAGTLADVTGMSFAVAADTAYWVQLTFACSSDNTTNDIIVDLVPSTGTPFVTTTSHTQGTNYSNAGALVTRAGTAFSSTSAALGSLVVNNGDGVVRMVNLNFYFTTSSAASLKFQAGCPTAGTATVYAGARMIVHKVRY